MAATTTRPTGPLSAQLLETIGVWSRSQRRSLRSLTEFRLGRNIDATSGPGRFTHASSLARHRRRRRNRHGTRVGSHRPPTRHFARHRGRVRSRRHLLLQGPGPHTHRHTPERSRTPPNSIRHPRQPPQPRFGGLDQPKQRPRRLGCSSPARSNGGPSQTGWSPSPCASHPCWPECSSRS